MNTKAHHDQSLEDFVEACAAKGIDPYEARKQGIAMRQAAATLRQFSQPAKPLTWAQDVFMGKRPD